MPDLIATCWSTAGTALPGVGDEISPLSLQYRMETAAKTGWQGFGILHTDLKKFVSENSFSELKKVIKDLDFKYIELEMINDWFGRGERRKKDDEVRKFLLDAAAELNAIHIKIGSETDGTVWPWQHLVDELGILSEQAKASGTRIALEVMPFTQIKSVEIGVDLVQDIGNPALGLLLDTWHVVHGGTSYEWLSKLSKRYIFGIELDDALLEIERDMFYDTVHNRKYCGEGEFKVADFIKAIVATGYSGPYGIEILSDEHRAKDFTQALEKARSTALAQFDIAFKN